MNDRKRPSLTSDEVRDLFRRAGVSADDADARLVDRVPDMLAEARRRRDETASPSLVDALVPLSARLLPAMAVATAVLIGVVVVTRPDPTTVAEADGTDAGLDRLVLIGSLDAGSEEDVLLRALVAQEANDE